MKIFKKLALLVTILSAFMLTACASGPIVGTVYEKVHEEAYSYTTNICSAYNDQGICTVNIPVWNEVPERWVLRVNSVEGEKRSAYVTEGEWEGYKVGDEYSDAHKYSKE